MQVDMSKHYTIPMLLRYSLPTIATMVFASIYGIVDGLFVSNYAGMTGFAAINFIMPFILILSSVGFMIGTGGNAIVAKTRGEGKDRQANGYFSMLVYGALIIGAILAILGAIFAEQIGYALGARGEMLELCTLYCRISMISLPMFVLQFSFQSFFATAGKPGFGFVVMLISGCTNIALDFVFVALLDMGVAGAAYATVTSEYIGAIIPIVYFARENSSFLRLGKPLVRARVFGKVCANGSSEMVAQLAASLVSVLYNIQLLSFYGEDGVAAFGVIMYTFEIFAAIFIGYTMGTAPFVSFQYGAQNKVEIRSLMIKSLLTMFVAGLCMFGLAELLAGPIAGVFVGYSQSAYDLTLYGFRVYSVAYILIGVSIYGSAFFTALNNGVISALIQFLRALVFESASVMLLPMFFGAGAIWYSIIVAEVPAVLLTLFLIYKFRNKYGYSKAAIKEASKACELEEARELEDVREEA